MDLIERYTVKGNFPLELGSAIRNISYSYPIWGIKGPELVLRIAGDRAYHTEWQEGTQKQMDYVIEAAETAGLGNCSAMLRDLHARTIFHVLNLPRMKNLSRINYTEPGAGASTVLLYKYLIDNGYDVGHLFSALIEPSEKRLSKAVGQLKELGLKEGKDFVPIAGKDSEMLFYLGEGTQHIVAYDGTLHHHAFQDYPIRDSFALLAPRGFFGNFDWYEGLCEHPARVYQALKTHKFKEPINWETKEKDLQAYAEMFPNALKEDYPRFSQADEMAARMITTFWLDGWAVARGNAIKAGEFDPRDDYFLHEAHGRPHKQVEMLKQTGFSLTAEEVQVYKPKMGLSPGERFSLTAKEVQDVMEAVGYNGNPHQILTKEEMLKLRMDELYDDIPQKGSNLLMGTLAQRM